MNCEEPVVGVHVYDDVFDASEFILQLEEDCLNEWGPLSWNDSKVGEGFYSEYRSSRECGLIEILKPYPRIKVSELFYDNIYDKIYPCLQNYIQTYNISRIAHEPFVVLKYMNGGNYRNHSDFGPENQRIFSMVAFLDNTSTGGNLEFPYFNTEIEAKPKRVVLFPANFPYSHIAHSVDDGIKYSLVTWFK